MSSIPCLPKGKKRAAAICGIDKPCAYCNSCGFNPEENERRKEIPLETDPKTGLRRKIIRRIKENVSNT